MSKHRNKLTSQHPRTVAAIKLLDRDTLELLVLDYVTDLADDDVLPNDYDFDAASLENLRVCIETGKE